MRLAALRVAALVTIAAVLPGEPKAQDVSPEWALAAATGRIPAAELRRMLRGTGFPCTGAYCVRLNSCAQAFVELNVCGELGRDRDADGMPCEGTRCPVLMDGRLVTQGGGTP